MMRIIPNKNGIKAGAKPDSKAEASTITKII